MKNFLIENIKKITTNKEKKWTKQLAEYTKSTKIPLFNISQQSQMIMLLR